MILAYHGGAPGLRVGQLVTPQPAGHGAHLVDGCPVCEARKAGAPLDEDVNDPALVYVTSDRYYASIYAHGYPRGGLYRVDTHDEELVETADDDPAPSWGVSSAEVVAVLDPLVRLSTAELRRIVRRYGLDLR